MGDATPLEQMKAARATALAMTRPDLETLVVTGSDRVPWLNGLLTCDLVGRSEGEARYGLAVGRSGRVLSDVLVVVDTPRERVLLGVPRGAVAGLREHLAHYLVMEDAEVASSDDGLESWMVHGPRAAEALRAALDAGAVGGAVDLTGLGGALVVTPSKGQGAERARAALASCALLGDVASWDVLRLERGVPRFGVDFDEKTYPQEASLETSAVSFAKGCYLGQEVVCMLQMRGHVKRKLVPLVLESPEPPLAGAAVTDESGAAAGQITSAATSPTLAKAVALAMVPRAQASTGQHLVVGGVRAEVVERPA